MTRLSEQPHTLGNELARRANRFRAILMFADDHEQETRLGDGLADPECADRARSPTRAAAASGGADTLRSA